MENFLIALIFGALGGVLGKYLSDLIERHRGKK